MEFRVTKYNHLSHISAIKENDRVPDAPRHGSFSLKKYKNFTFTYYYKTYKRW